MTNTQETEETSFTNYLKQKNHDLSRIPVPDKNRNTLSWYDWIFDGHPIQQ